ncbi:MAG: DUF4136 domain-containing protein [Candidatus Korobacteraceae bacterium]
MDRSRTRILFYAMLSFLLVVGSLVAQAQKIHVVYNKQIDFSQFKTFAWAPHGAVAHPMLAANIVGAIEDELKQRGLQKVEINNNPGLIIQVYGAIDQDSTFYSNDPLYNATGGIPPFDPSFSGSLWSGYYGNTTVTIHKGQLVVDLIDAANKKLVWRGMSQQNLAAHDPNKLVSQVNNAISKMFKQYPGKVEG